MKIIVKTTIILLIASFCFLFVNQSTTAHAATDWYEEHQEQIPDMLPKNIDKFLQKYSAATNSVKCDRFNIPCHIKSFIFSIAMGAVNLAKSGIKLTIISPTQILDNPTFNKYQSAISALSKTLAVIFLMFQMAKIVSLRMSESDDGGIIINETLLNVVIIGVFLFLYADIIKWILTLQEMLNNAVVNATSSEIMAINMMTGMFLIMPIGGVFAIIVFAIIVILLLILVLQLFYRVALVALLYMVGPAAIATKLNDTYNFFDFWIKQFVSTFLTFFLQLLCVMVGLKLFTGLAKGGIFDFFVGCAFFVLAISVPKLLGEWGASTGSTRTAAKGVKLLTRKGK